MATGDEKIDLAALRRIADRCAQTASDRSYTYEVQTAAIEKARRAADVAHELYRASTPPPLLLALLDRVEAAERDAARYRHWRKHYLRVSDRVIGGPSRGIFTLNFDLPGDDPDAAIDADIARRKG